ncbi:head completion protein [Bacillus phage vB_BcM_Sam46]|uniref:Head completion protein n=1 Tax=Bacillus phage vB_BcM_Sam46 TaxID=2719179 RepID=A0A6G9L8B3_9CAUD|nr:head completion protein [Bacillus phage vB_BcM_Sam46]
MLLTDLEACLDIKIAPEKEATYKKRLAAAINEAITYCNNDFKNAAGELDIPDGAQMGIALLVKGSFEQHNVQSQSLGDMSKSFFQGGTATAGYTKLNAYKRGKKVGYR